MSTIIGAETTAKVEIQPRGKIIAYWVTTALLAFVVGSGGIGELSHQWGTLETVEVVGISGVLPDHSRDLESAWDDSHPRAGFSAA